MKFIDLFAGMGGFHRALRGLGHECVFASEINQELASLYALNFPETRARVFGDIRSCKNRVPRHDVLCAGFPCQPFSKSGYQNGRRDRTRGTLFHEILEILEHHRPPFVILENVGNFERHNRGRTWRIVGKSLSDLGYHVRGTTHKASGGHGLISPHHLGFPHTRERFFVLASLDELPPDPFPDRDRTRRTRLVDIVQSRRDLSGADIEETKLTVQQAECIEHWNRLLKGLPSSVDLPSFPIWGDEIDASYPFEDLTPFSYPLKALRRRLGVSAAGASRAELLAALPSYARTRERRFPDWKVHFIQQNRGWWGDVAKYVSNAWLKRLRDFPPSLRKLEWNCKGEEPNLWNFVLQFRPSGLRAKRYTSSPALVAMTTTQIPILGPERRFLTRREALRLQGFPDDHALPSSRAAAFAALGNAVHVGVVRAIASRLLDASGTYSRS
jgi:DNA (cytosine-5)-methyltransferase 1